MVVIGPWAAAHPYCFFYSEGSLVADDENDRGSTVAARTATLLTYAKTHLGMVLFACGLIVWRPPSFPCLSDACT